MTEYVVFSYKSGRFAPSLAIHRTRPALNSRVSINNTHSLTHTVQSFWSLLINTSLSYNTSKGAEMGHIMLQ